VQNRRVIGKLSCAFLEKTVGPCKIAGIVRDSAEDAGNLGIAGRELSRFLREFKRLLVVL
jgi:hypothetical protein